jgi:hypothetical protein
MLAQLESLLLPKSNWVQVPGRKITNFVNLDYVVGYTAGQDRGYNFCPNHGGGRGGDRERRCGKCQDQRIRVSLG